MNARLSPPLGDAESGPRRPLEALLVVDLASGALLFADRDAAELFGPADAAGLAPRRLLAQLSDLSTREFVTRIRRGEREHEVSVSVEPLLSGPFNPGDAVLVRIRGTERLPPATRDEQTHRRESLWNLIVRRGFASSEQVRALLREGASGLGCESAILGQITDGELHVLYVAGAAGVATGDRLPLARTTARDAVRLAGTFAASDTVGDSSFRDLAYPARSFLSAAFRVGNAQWSASFTSTQPRAQPFDDDDWGYAEFLCEALARAIERSESDAQLEFRAYTDLLTDLPNRPAIEHRLDETLAEAQRLEVVAAVLFVDIDGFKAVNDSVSHEAGDAVLREVAERLRGSLRREEFIGRWGGDEFVIVLLPVKSPAQIEAVAARISNVLAKPFAYAERTFELGASIGVALYPDDETDARKLVDAADAAMYRAKEDGGARIHFHDGRRAGGPHVPAAPSTAEPDPAPGDAPQALWAPGAPEAAPAAVAPEAVPPAVAPEAAPPAVAPEAAPPAVAPEPGAYLVTFEPIYYLREADVCAAEAVVRRVHSERGLLAAAASLPSREDAQTLRALDEWVLRETLAVGRTLACAGFELAMDVRLTAHDPGLFERLYPAGFTSSDWRRIRIAISARQAAAPSPEFDGFLEGCARYGLGLVLDGFDGSLAELHAVAALPVFTLRINCRAIERMAAQPGGMALLEGTLSGARALGWRMIAGDVETLEQRDLVVALGVDGVQGPYVGHAMTAIDFASWIQARAGLRSQS